MRAKRVEGGCLRFFCPGCDQSHVIRTEGPGRWSWNGSLDRPTFAPSVLTWIDPDPQAQPGRYRDGFRCHSFVTDGRIRFLDDCTHALVGQTVDLPEIDE